MIVTDRVTVTGRPQHYCVEGNLGEGKVWQFQILSVHVYILEIYQLVSFFRVIVIIRIGVNFRVFFSNRVEVEEGRNHEKNIGFSQI